MRFSEIRKLLWPAKRKEASTPRRIAQCFSIEDLRKVARKRTPGAVFEYVDGGADDEYTLGRNREVFEKIQFAPRILVDVERIDTSTTVLGASSRGPLVLAPTGWSRMVHTGGELAVARAAGRAGLVYCMSTVSTTSIESVAEIATGPLWFQLYVWKDHSVANDLIERAKRSGYQALVLTVDTAVRGNRERDLRNGLTVPATTLTAKTLFQGVVRPRWSWDFLKGDMLTFSNVIRDGVDSTQAMAFASQEFDQSLTWKDLEWIREAWSGPLVIKGLISVEDANRCAEHGASGVILSNHGGRQLESTPAPIEILSEIVDAVGDQLEVFVDSGFRRGTDIVKALALGARACLIGRAYLYGLAAAGEEGVDRAITLLTDEIRRTMALLGAPDLVSLDRSLLRFSGFDGESRRQRAAKEDNDDR